MRLDMSDLFVEYLHAKTPRREGEEKEKYLCVLAPLREVLRKNVGVRNWE